MKVGGSLDDDGSVLLSECEGQSEAGPVEAAPRVSESQSVARRRRGEAGAQYTVHLYSAAVLSCQLEPSQDREAHSSSAVTEISTLRD